MSESSRILLNHDDVRRSGGWLECFFSDYPFWKECCPSSMPSLCCKCSLGSGPPIASDRLRTTCVLLQNLGLQRPRIEQCFVQATSQQTNSDSPSTQLRRWLLLRESFLMWMESSNDVTRGVDRTPSNSSCSARLQHTIGSASVCVCIQSSFGTDRRIVDMWCSAPSQRTIHRQRCSFSA